MALTKISRGLLNTGVSDSSDATAITIDSSERVGIGTSSPSKKLHVEMAGDAALFDRTASAGGVMQFASGGTVKGNVGVQSGGFGLGGGFRDPDLFVATGGNVGLGTTSPDVMLDVRGEVSVDYNATHGLRFYNQARNNWSSIGNRDTGTGATLQFKTGNATAIHLAHTGEFTHMGTTAFTAGVTSFRKRNLNSVDMAEVAVGGGYAANDTFIVYDTTNNATRFKVNYQGTVYATSTTISSLSDERLKENVRDLDKGLADILKLKPRRFDWKAEEGSGKTDVTGFIAQECETAGFEEFVGTVDFSETIKNVKTFGYGGLVPALVKSIQELSTRLEAAEARITTLEG